MVASLVGRTGPRDGSCMDVNVTTLMNVVWFGQLDLRTTVRIGWTNKSTKDTWPAYEWENEAWKHGLLFERWMEVVCWVAWSMDLTV